MIHGINQVIIVLLSASLIWSQTTTTMTFDIHLYYLLIYLFLEYCYDQIYISASAP